MTNLKPRGSSLYFFLLMLTELTSIVCGWDVSAVASDAVLGSDFTLKCDLTGIDSNAPPDTEANPTLLYLYIDSSTLDPPRFVSYFDVRKKLTIDPSSVNSRYSYNGTTSTLTIRDVECSDQMDLTCLINVFITADEVKSNEASLVPKAPPLVPLPMTTSPVNLTRVKEGDSVSATCIANTGRPNKGRIQWRIYRDDVEEIISGNGGNGVTIRTSQTSPSGAEPSCTQRTNSRITVENVTVEDQKLVLTCFVLNDDYPSQPTNCDSAEASLCQQSETIRILYSVRDIKVSRVPGTSDVGKGQNVRLTCGAKGFPQPTFEWLNVEANRTLSSDQDGQLILNNVEMKDSGNYSCTATNVVDGVTHHVTEVTAFNVVEPPPTTTPDPTSSTSDVDPTRSPSSSGSDDDSTTIIIIVVVLVVAIVIAVIVIICIYRKKRMSKEDPPRPKDISFYNNKQSLGGPPDVLGDEKKKPVGGTLNNSFDMQNEDGLMYADLTYDNRPRSRKPMAIGDAASDYSDVQMPQV